MLWQTSLKQSLWRTLSGGVVIDNFSQRPTFIATDDINHRKGMLRRFYLDNGEEAGELLLGDIIRDFSFAHNGKELLIAGFVRDLYRVDLENFTLVRHYKNLIPKYSNVSTMATQNTLLIANTTDLAVLDISTEAIFKKKLKECCHLQVEADGENVLCFSKLGEISRFHLGKKKFTPVLQTYTPFCRVRFAKNGAFVLHGGKIQMQSGVNSVVLCDFVWVYRSLTDENPTKINIKTGIHLFFVDDEAKVGYFCEQNEVWAYDLQSGEKLFGFDIPPKTRIMHLWTDTKHILLDNHYDTKEKPVLSLYKFQ